MTGVPMSFGASTKSHSVLAWEPAKHSRIISSARPSPHFALRGIALPHQCSGINVYEQSDHAGGYHGGGDPAHNRTELSGDRTKRLGATAHLPMAVLPAAWSVVTAVSMITKGTRLLNAAPARG
jgi:hypothetical protein